MLAAGCRAIPARTRPAPSAGPTGSGPAGTRYVPHGPLTSGYSANADRGERTEDVVAQVGLGEDLVSQGITKVTVESTSDYWRIWFYLLEAAGVDVQLVNARDAKNLPGRPRTDKLDAVWPAKLTEKGLLRPSFVPPEPIRR